MDKLPITSSNFADLAKTGFYDGLTFHRVIQVRFMQLHPTLCAHKRIMRVGAQQAFICSVHIV
eukprot:scaffold101553_cov30-Tisochrysis_lutea.AAC.1